MTRPTRKFAISDFKGIVGKVAQELVSNQSGIDISNFDFRHAGALNIRRGIKDCISGLNSIRGLKRFYGNGGARSLLIADTNNIYNGDVVLCVATKISIFTQGLATTRNGLDIVNFSGDVSAQSTGFKQPTNETQVSNTADVPNAFSSNDVRATARDDTNITFSSFGVRTFNFGTFIPEGSTIDGIEVKVEGFKVLSNSWNLESARLFGISGPHVPKNMTTTIGPNDSEETLGDATDLWGGTPTRDEIVSVGFAVILTLDMPIGDTSLQQFKCDAVRVNIHFTGSSAIPPIIQNVKVGDIFFIDSDGVEYIITEVLSSIVFQANGTTVDFVDSNPDTVVRAAGSWIDDGFLAGMEITITNASNPANNGTFQIDVVTDTTLTLSAGAALTGDLADNTATITTAVGIRLNIPFVGTFVNQPYTINKILNNTNKLDLVLVQSKNRIYGANGVGQAFEWNGGEQINDIGLEKPDQPTGVEGVVGSIPNGVYKYKITFVSEFGESNPSTEISVTVSAGPSEIDLTNIVIGSEKILSRNIFRTVADGDDFFFLDSIDDNFVSTFTDNITDAVLIGGTVLFSPEDHDKPPVLKYIEWHKNHLFGAEPNSNIVRFSDLDFPDHWPAFNQFRTLSGENVERLASLGDLLVIYTRNTIQVLLGDNEENFLLQGIETSFGLTAPFSVADVPANSLFYLSQTGIRQFAGRTSPRLSDPIERLLFDEKSKHRINKLALAKVCAIHTDDKFYMLYPRKKNTANDAILVFDFLTKDWYILDIAASAIESFDGVGDQNELFIGTETGEIKQIETGEDDNGEKIEAKYTTRYINMGSHDLKYYVNIFLKVFATGTADVILIASTESRPGTVDKAFLNLRDISRGQDLFWNLPNDMKGEGIQVRLVAKGTNQVRIERMVIEHSNQPEADNAKDDS